jgi:hypothetical protein
MSEKEILGELHDVHLFWFRVRFPFIGVPFKTSATWSATRMD